MATINIYAGWIGILLGALAGAVHGMFFFKEKWLGGYSSWPRRLTRLGHISLFGTALLNLCFAFTVRSIGPSAESDAASWLFIIGSVTMPLVCYLAAMKMSFRQLFPVPVLSLIAGICLTLYRVLIQ
jgi:hypothetical protein